MCSFPTADRPLSKLRLRWRAAAGTPAGIPATESSGWDTPMPATWFARWRVGRHEDVWGRNYVGDGGLVRSLRRLSDCRRGDDGLWPYRHDVRMRTGRRGFRFDVPLQGPDRRIPAHGRHAGDGRDLRLV